MIPDGHPQIHGNQWFACQYPERLPDRELTFYFNDCWPCQIALEAEMIRLGKIHGDVVRVSLLDNDQIIRRSASWPEYVEIRAKMDGARRHVT